MKSKKGQLKKNNINIFLDMDGVLAEQSHELVNYMYNKDFFRKLPAVLSMLQFAKILISTNKYNVFILSSVIDSPYCEVEKDLWLNEHLPEISSENRLFVPYGINKSDFVKSKMKTKNTINILIDDFTVNLVGWSIENGIGVKVLNNINNTKGTWVKNGGFAINAYHNPEDNINIINNLILEKTIELNISKRKDVV